MSLTDGIEGLTEEQVSAINANATKQYEGYESPDQVRGLKDSQQALLTEKKAAEEARSLAAKEADDARMETAAKNGDFESYKKSVDLKREESDQKYNDLLAQNKSNAISAEVSKLAAELGGDNAHLLSLHIEKRLRYEDGKVKVIDQDGGLTISTLDDLKKEFRNNPMFASAIVGSKASGGGANTGSNSGGAAASVTFDSNVSDKAANLGHKIKGFSDLPVN